MKHLDDILGGRVNVQSPGMDEPANVSLVRFGAGTVLEVVPVGDDREARVSLGTEARVQVEYYASAGVNTITLGGPTDLIFHNDLPSGTVVLNFDTQFLNKGATISIRVIAVAGSTTEIQDTQGGFLFVALGQISSIDRTYWVIVDADGEVQRHSSFAEMLISGYPVSRVNTDPSIVAMFTSPGYSPVATLSARVKINDVLYAAIVTSGIQVTSDGSNPPRAILTVAQRATGAYNAITGENFLSPSGSTDYIVTNNVPGPNVDLNIQTTNLIAGDTVSIRLLAAQGSTTYISQAGKTQDLYEVTGLAVAADMTFFVRFDGTDLQRLTSVSGIVVDGRPVQRIITDSTITVAHSGTELDRVATISAVMPSRFRLGVTEWVESCGDSARLAGALSATAVGTGAGASHGTVTELDGCLNCTTGTTSTGEYRIEQSACSQAKLGHGELIVGFSVKTQGALSDATETYSLLFGFTDTVSASYSNAVCVKYTHSINGGKFQFETRYDGTSTLVDTGVTVAINTLYKIVIVGSANGASVDCYINGSLVATSTTNIPAEARKMGVTARIVKSAGTTARNYYLSQIKFRKENTYEAFDL